MALSATNQTGPVQSALRKKKNEITDEVYGAIFNDNQISSGQAKRPTNRNTWKKVNTNKKVFESGG